MGHEKGLASAALSKVVAELRVQPKSPEVCLDALPTRLSFLLCSGFPSKCARSEFPIPPNWLKTSLSFSCLLSRPGFPFFPHIPVNQEISCLPWALSGADQRLEAAVEELWHFQEGEGAAGRLQSMAGFVLHQAGAHSLLSSLDYSCLS